MNAPDRYVSMLSYYLSSKTSLYVYAQFMVVLSLGLLAWLNGKSRAHHDMVKATGLRTPLPGRATDACTHGTYISNTAIST